MTRQEMIAHFEEPEYAMTEIEKVGAHAAMTAIDQAGDMGGLEESIDSYWTNLGDTLTEMGARDKCDEANRGFEHVLVENGIAYRPHGL
jgi:hypothetical protein